MSIFFTSKPIPKEGKPKKEKPSMAAFFQQIWNSRDHLCQNCKGWLGTEAKTWYFSHILPKSLRPDLKLEESNIELLCFTCHGHWETHDYDEFYRRTDTNRGKNCTGFGVNCP